MNVMYKLLGIVLLVVMLAGCSSDNTTSDADMTDDAVVLDSTYYIPPKEIVTVKDSIEVMLNDAMARLRYFDNSGLYENEFGYLTDEVPFDEYLDYGQIKQRQKADVEKILVNSVEMFEHDSAMVSLNAYLDFRDGKTYDTTSEHMIVYYHRGRWIKPTVSVISHQVDYDELVRQAEEAAKWEE